MKCSEGCCDARLHAINGLDLMTKGVTGRERNKEWRGAGELKRGKVGNERQATVVFPSDGGA